MDRFGYKNGELLCEGVGVSELAERVGTPLYVYSAGTLLDHYNAFAEAFAALDPLICFSIKSLANVHILKLLADAGSGFDIVSGGDLARALAAGADASKMAFAGVGKTDREIREAIAAGVMLFNVESEAEFANLSLIACETGATARAALRINPDVYDPKTHRYTATGKAESKFGVDIDRAEAFFAAHGRDEHVRLDTVHLHIGSPIYSADPYVEAIGKALSLIERLGGQGLRIEALDIGGGYAADYEEGSSPTAAEYAERIVPLLAGTGLKIILEPGRQIAANAGILLSRVLYTKSGRQKDFVIVDAAMTDLIRPALYQAEHFVYPVALPDGSEPPPRRMDYRPPQAVRVDVVGGLCEGSDFLARDRMLPPVARGDLLAVFAAGAYGFTMSSQYNSRPRAAEVLVDGDSWKLIRRRENYDDLMAPELDV